MAKATGFAQRQGVLQPYDFLVLMTLGQFGMKHPSLGGMVGALKARMSREALHQRFTASAAQFLKRCLHTILHQKFQGAGIRTMLLRPFGRVLLVDSSSWDVSPKLQKVWPGAGGNASPANCKIQVAYDYKQGELIFLEPTAGTVPDNRYTDRLPALLNPQDLVLMDQGYFKLRTLNAIMARDAYFLTRFMVGTTVEVAQTGAPLDLDRLLGPGARPDLGDPWCAWARGPQQTNSLPPRVLARESPDSPTTRRRVKAHAQQQGRTAQTLDI
ncbi:MAG: IS4 family transposase [Nitrospiraceae bacterium]|nr:IS4 family transposase [Nitrospiraceae bacterium]